MLRDSFLDLIPALCFHIHGWEDGSLCQSILFLCSDSAVKRNCLKRNARRFYIPNHSKLLFAFRTAHDEIYRDLRGNISQRNELCTISRLRTGCKDKILCVASWIRAIEGRKSKTIFCDGVFQFRSVSSVINACDKSLLRSPGSAARLR